VLGIQCLVVVAKDVVESAEESQAHADLWMEGTIDVGQQIVGFRDELVALFQVALCDLGLAVGEKVVGVGCLGGNVLDNWIHVENVFLVEGFLVFGLEVVLAQEDLNSILLAE